PYRGHVQLQQPRDEPVARCELAVPAAWLYRSRPGQRRSRPPCDVDGHRELVQPERANDRWGRGGRWGDCRRGGLLTRSYCARDVRTPAEQGVRTSRERDGTYELR